MPKQFDYVEDYIHFLAGHVKGSYRRTTMVSPVRLATYDVKIVESLSLQAEAGTPFTDKQSELATRLIEKYERQLSNKDVVQPLKPYKFRNGVRQVNRTKSVMVNEDGKIEMRFPFDPKVVQLIKDMLKETKGSGAWNDKTRTWTIAPTEFNINWICEIAKAKGFYICPEVEAAMAEIVECEQTQFKIVLRLDKDLKPYIENAPQSMIDWLEENVGFDDLLALVDNSFILKYDVDPEIMSMIRMEYGPKFVDFLETNTVDPNVAIERVIEWAAHTNRFPVFVYNPNKIVPEFRSPLISKSEMQIYGDNSVGIGEPTFDLRPGAKLVYFSRSIPDFNGRVPLLISTINLHIGTNRRNLAGKAERLVYLCTNLNPGKR